MTTISTQPLKLFYCYAHEDKALRDELDNHLSLLKHQRLITSWYDREILPGTNWEEEIDTQLTQAQIILLLVSASFLASDYCYSIEMQRALERHTTGTARVIPIILRRVYWEDAPFSHLQVLPTGAKPVAQWQDRDEAFWDITQGIRRSIKELQHLLKTKNEWLQEGITLYDLKRYEEALDAFEHALRLDPSYIPAWYGKGNTLHIFKRYKEAFDAFEHALRLDPSSTSSWHGKGNALRGLKRYEEALDAFEHALRLDPSYTYAWNGKGNALEDLKRYEEALDAYEHALHLDPSYAIAWNGKGNALEDLKRYEEALDAYEHALHLDPSLTYAQTNKASLLKTLKRKLY